MCHSLAEGVSLPAGGKVLGVAGCVWAQDGALGHTWGAGGPVALRDRALASPEPLWEQVVFSFPPPRRLEVRV